MTADRRPHPSPARTPLPALRRLSRRRFIRRRFTRRRADRRFGERLVAAVLAFAVAAVPTAVLLVLIEAGWGPLRELDADAAARLNEAVRHHPLLLETTRVLSNRIWDPVTMRLLVAATVGWLLVRRAWRLALWAGLTETAAGLTGLLVKVSVARVRPRLPEPVAHAPGFSFPSGHAMTAMASCAILLLVLLPVVPRRARPAAWTLAAVTVLGTGLTRIALGVHWASDVLGGWLLGLALVASTAWAFEAWRRESGLRTAGLPEGLEPELAAEDELRPRPPGGPQP
ncbi:phosphatase PAP2 family protein [Kitasatospora sp. A2-31]|uniref:phosphatase PAP2 family protein n=1 Tax=Kitasatospora sp. A2-31 TaxID=2916414 RepID=UPI001EEB6850|nr:phosphatase PAP2 family protein [Kitasatospora sp. A2-31]MCG6497701.1 phosphatase PAP2 family protein [Kitasatospora sp. A2-31]